MQTFMPTSRNPIPNYQINNRLYRINEWNLNYNKLSS